MSTEPDLPESEIPPFSDQLEGWLRIEGSKTIGSLGEVFEERSFAVTILFLMFIPALPLPTGGITHVFELITVLLGLELVFGARTIWLPARWRERELGATTIERALPFMVRRIRFFERFSKIRGARLLSQHWFQHILGLLFIGLAVASAVAPPFSGLDTLPAMGAVAVALGMILEDLVVVGIGVGLGALGVALIVTLGAALIRLIAHLF